MTLHSTILLATALLIFGEALALLIGTGLVVKPRPVWFNSMNVAFMADDLFFGTILSLVALGLIQPAWIFWVSIVSTFLSHVWRDAQVAAKSPDRFCMNTALFIVNNVKLLGLVLCVLLRAM